MEKEYYIEFVDKRKSNYIMQTTIFPTKEDALDWFNANMQYVDSNIRVCLMKKNWSDDGEQYEIEFVKNINIY